MGERGVVGMDRGVFEHELLKGEPYTRVQAWLWLVAEAAWKPRRSRVAGTWIELDRAQLAHSLGHMAEKWQWTVKRVRYFLARLVDDGMVEVGQKKGTGRGIAVTVLTICNYDEYQKVALPKGTVEGTPGASQGQQPKEGKEEEEREGRSRASSTISPEAFALADRFYEAIGVDRCHPELSGVAGAPWSAQMWIARGYDHDLILATAADLAARHGGNKTLNFYTECFETAHKKQRTKGQREMPLFQTVENSHAQARPDRTRGAVAPDWQTSRDRFREARAVLKASIAADDDREAHGGQDARPIAALGRK